MPRLVRVTAPSRLHFGLWSLGGGSRQFGGVGAMITDPGLKLEIAPALELSADGPLAARAVAFARKWADFHRVIAPDCKIQILNAPPEHVGLGTGTQLGLAVAAGLNAWIGLPAQNAPELAISVQRGLRSAVGTYGFVLGGLIVEQGKLPGEPISPLDCRVALPEEWRFVLVRPAGLAGLAGDEEANAISALDAIPNSITEKLIAEARDHLVPAAAMADFPAFAESMYRYGNLAGQCFAPKQQGPYNGPVLAGLVETIRGLGYPGVGQSSWGPTLFVVTANNAVAHSLAEQLKAEWDDLDLTITAPCNTGALVEMFEDRFQSSAM